MKDAPLDYFKSLPPELWSVLLAEFIDTEDALTLRLVCKHIKLIIDEYRGDVLYVRRDYWLTRKRVNVVDGWPTNEPRVINFMLKAETWPHLQTLDLRDIKLCDRGVFNLFTGLRYRKSSLLGTQLPVRGLLFWVIPELSNGQT